MKEKRGKGSSKEDYLRIIHELYEEGGVRSVDIANSLGISKASVSEMLRKLASDNFVKINLYSKVLLTRKGKKHAEKHYDKHDTIKKFMKFIGHEDEKAKEQAHELEHSFSEESTDMLREIVEGEKELKDQQIPNYIG